MEPDVYKNFRLGNNQVQYLYQGTTLVWPPETPHPGNPDIRLEYISNGTARTQPNVYFDTQFTWTNTTQVECKYSYHSAINNTALLGCYGGTGWTKEYTFMLRGVTRNTGSSTVYQRTALFYNKTGFNSGTYENHSGVVIGTPEVDTPHIFRTSAIAEPSGEMAVYFDNAIYKYSNIDYISTVSTGNIYLFAANNVTTNTPARFAPADTRIYALKIYHGNVADPVLYRYFIPVLHYNEAKEEYEPCLYDKVSHTYFYNKGTDPVGYAIYYYHGQQDFVLDYIERDNTGYLQYTTDCDVSTNVNFNVGFTVGNRKVKMTDLTQNVVVGSRYDPSSKFGLFFPYYDSSTTFAFVALGGSTRMTYDASLHTSDNHRADHIEFYMSKGAAGTFIGAHAVVKWMELPDGVLPDENTYIKRGDDPAVSFTEVDSSVVGTPIGIFSGNTVHSQVSTRIYYVDISKYHQYTEKISGTTRGYAIHESKGSFIPMYHHGEVCFVDPFTNVVLYNSGPGTPRIMELG